MEKLIDLLVMIDKYINLLIDELVDILLDQDTDKLIQKLIMMHYV